MRQFLFVVKKGRIAFWKFQRGCLSRMSLNGNDWNAYNSAFWDEWCGANLPEDFEDAILLSDRPDEPVELPSWFNRPDNEASKWTLETFSKIVNDGEFAGKGVGIYLGTKKYVFASGSPEENFWFYPREGNLCTQLGDVKEKQIQRAVAEEQEKNRAVEELKKRKVELARKRAEEESRTERQKKGSSRKEKVSKKRNEEQYNYEEYLQSQFAAAKGKSTRDGELVTQDRTVGRQKKVSLRKKKLSKQGDEEQHKYEKYLQTQFAVAMAKRTRDDGELVQQVRLLLHSYPLNCSGVCKKGSLYDNFNLECLTILHDVLTQFGYEKAMASDLVLEVEKCLKADLKSISSCRACANEKIVLAGGSDDGVEEVRTQRTQMHDALMKAVWGLMGVVSLVKNDYTRLEFMTLREILSRTNDKYFSSQDEYLEYWEVRILPVVRPYCQ